MKLWAWCHQVRFVLTSIFLWIPAICFIMYEATNTLPKTEGIVKITFRLVNINSRFDLSAVKSEGHKVATKAKGVATKVVSEAASRASSATRLIDELPKEVTLGSDQVCWHYGENQCQRAPSDFEAWFPKAARAILFTTSNRLRISTFWTNIRVQTCIVVSAVGLWLYFAVLCTALLQLKIPTAMKPYGLVVEVAVLLLIFVPSAFALLVIKFISDGLKRVSILEVTDGDLSQWILTSFAFATISVLAYLWHRRNEG